MFTDYERYVLLYTLYLLGMGDSFSRLSDVLPLAAMGWTSYVYRQAMRYLASFSRPFEEVVLSLLESSEDPELRDLRFCGEEGYELDYEYLCGVFSGGWESYQVQVWVGKRIMLGLRSGQTARMAIRELRQGLRCLSFGDQYLREITYGLMGMRLGLLKGVRDMSDLRLRVTSGELGDDLLRMELRYFGYEGDWSKVPPGRGGRQQRRIIYGFLGDGERKGSRSVSGYCLRDYLQVRTCWDSLTMLVFNFGKEYELTEGMPGVEYYLTLSVYDRRRQLLLDSSRRIDRDPLNMRVSVYRRVYDYRGVRTIGMEEALGLGCADCDGLLDIGDYVDRDLVILDGGRLYSLSMGEVVLSFGVNWEELQAYKVKYGDLVRERLLGIS